MDRALLAAMQASAAGAEAVAARRARRRPRHAPPPPEGPLRVLLLAAQPASNAGTRHRLALWAGRLRERGHTVELDLPVPSARGDLLHRRWLPRDRAEYHLRALASRLRSVRRADRFHVAVVHMTDLPHWEYGLPFVAQAVGRLAGRLVLDLDDLPVVRGETAPGPRARALAELADGLVLGSRALFEWFPGRPAWHVPTCVDPRAFPAAGSGDAPELVWIGTAGNLPALEALATPLRDACRRHAARLRVVCDRPAELPGVPQEHVPWTPEAETSALAGAAVGLAPLPDGPVERCKCGLKALQYMAAGAAVVASPVGALREIVVPGETGLLASSPAEWGAALDRLLRDRSAAARLGACGRARAERHFSPEAHLPKYESALRGGGV